jgi:hypothetical protein
LEATNLSTKDIGFAHREELLEEVVGASIPSILGGDSFMVGIKPLIHTHEQSEQEEAKMDDIRCVMPLMVKVPHTSMKCCRCAFASYVAF